MKKIAITQRLLINEIYYECREALDIRWGLLFKELGFLPIVLPTEYDFEIYFEALDIDGICITGGNDLNTLNPNELSKKRDEFEKRLIKYGIEQNIPIYGICRGMQIIAEYFGCDLEEVENQVNITHPLQINPLSKFANKLKQLKHVNSFHTYRISSLHNSLLVSATHENGTIKAMEHKDYKIFAQMWHSERESPFNPEELDLIKSFFFQSYTANT
jgi:N5-(cytidine 5'-diphosphoramidyl)-L-glutamine hydrolase